MQKSNYIDFKSSGRLFPTWVMHNFSKFQLEDIPQKMGDDPCKKEKSNNSQKLELRLYQKFASVYLDFKGPYRDILLYHGLGSGKTASAINVYNALYNYTPGWNVFIMIKASLKGGWLTDLKKWLSSEESEFRRGNIKFINYDSPYADKNFMDAVKNSDSSKKSMYIIDEVHNFIRNVYTNMSSDKGKRAQNIYDYIIQDKLDNTDTRVVLLSFTPAINKPFELALLFNLMRPGIFPKSQNEFDSLFIKNIGYEVINSKNVNLFQRRILGLVSYYIGATPDLYASKSIEYVDVVMSEYQEDVYSFFEDIEMKMALNSKGTSQTYKSYTRQASNFVFPPLTQRVNGELRPRPGHFRIKETTAEQIMENENEDITPSTNITQYLAVINMFISELKKYFDKENDKDKNAKYLLIDDIINFKKNYENKSFQDFDKNETKKSNLYKAMHKCSAKFLNAMFNITRSSGPVLVYSNYVYMEGLQIFKIYVSYIGFYNYSDTRKYQKGKIGYVEFHGGIKKVEDRYSFMNEFNKPDNKYGDLLKIIMISPAGSEGLNLRNVRQVHIIEPYWNEVRIVQMIGRAIRACSHEELKIEERHVQVYRYRSVRKNKERQTTDQYIEEHARNKDALIQSFQNAMKEAAIDCNLNKAHNMIDEQYKCFQFDETSLFEENIGPAYIQDIEDDSYFNNGLHNENSVTIKIKVIKIDAVKLISNKLNNIDNIDDADNLNNTNIEQSDKYSEVKTYWYYPKSRVVYDYDLKYPIGKVGVSETGLPLKLNEKTYIITKIIPFDI
jgi:superfamily II DNA or RNA helicase